MPNRTPLVLVIDDDPTIRRLLTELLEEDGYAVAAMPDGRVALAAVAHGALTPDVVLVDLVMPAYGGDRFVADYRRLDAAPVPMILMSALPGKTTVVAGVTAHLAKPFNIDELSTLMAQQLGVPV